jgi:hypothetical protein
VQPIQMPHDHEVGGRHGPRQIINCSTTMKLRVARQSG